MTKSLQIVNSLIHTLKHLDKLAVTVLVKHYIHLTYSSHMKPEICQWILYNLVAEIIIHS